jgi:hypothetical protein
LKILRQKKDLIIKPTDKNLGPALMDLDSYVKQVLEEHLLTKDYEQLSEATAKQRMAEIKSTL